MHSPRIRVAAYVTRTVAGRRELLVFEHRDHPEAGIQIPAGGVRAGERLDDAAAREVSEETGVGPVALVGVLGAQVRAHPVTGEQRVTVFVHLESDDPRDAWMHGVDGAPDDRDFGLVLLCRFCAHDAAASMLADAQGQFLHLAR